MPSPEMAPEGMDAEAMLVLAVMFAIILAIAVGGSVLLAAGLYQLEKLVGWNSED